MKLNFTKLKPNSPDFRKVKQLYMRAFPDDERAPFLMLVLKAKKKGVDFWSISCDGQWAGMLYIVNHRDLSYVFYLAVSEELRGRGIGSATAKLMLKYCFENLKLHSDEHICVIVPAVTRRRAQQYPLVVLRDLPEGLGPLPSAHQPLLVKYEKRAGDLPVFLDVVPAVNR